MTFRRTLALGLMLAIVGAWVATGRAQSAATGGALAVPLPGQQAWTVDAAVVSSANHALINYARLGSRAQRLAAPQARAVAKFRRAALERLIPRDPRHALLLSLAPAERQGLPKFVIDLLEQRVHERGDLLLTIEETIPDLPPGPNDPQDPVNPPNGQFLTDNPNPQDVPQPESRTYWRARLGDVSYQAAMYGLRLNHQTKFDTPIHGIALGDVMAVSESPLYQADLWETVQFGFQPGDIVALDGHLPVPLANLRDFVALERKLIGEVLAPGPRPFPFNYYQWSTGQKDVLVLKVRYADSPITTPHTDADILTAFLVADIFFRTNSEARTWLNPTIHPEPLVLRGVDYYTSHDRLESDAIVWARDLELDPDAYDRVVVMSPELFGRPVADAGAVAGGRVVRISGRSPALSQTLTHELGHTYGFPESGFWFLPGDTLLDPLDPGGVNVRNGDYWDVMGSQQFETVGRFFDRHFNAYFKALAGWLPAGAVANGRTDGDRSARRATGQFRLYPHDSPSPSGLRAIYVDAPGGVTYWIGKRSLFPDNPSMADGVEVRLVQTASDIHGPVELLDMDQGRGVWGTLLHSLGLGTFRDFASRVEIGTNGESVDEDGHEYQRVFVTNLP
jgi:hypothetical protein